jgi:hypothetical protein
MLRTSGYGAAHDGLPVFEAAGQVLTSVDGGVQAVAQRQLGQGREGCKYKGENMGTRQHLPLQMLSTDHTDPSMPMVADMCPRAGLKSTFHLHAAAASPGTGPRNSQLTLGDGADHQPAAQPRRE